MGIISKFIKRLISGAAEPQQAQVQSGNTVSNEYNYSEKDKLIVQMTAESALRVFTESLDIANKSKNLATRESRLQVARNKLIELKNMEKQFPFLHLENLQAVEASISGVEAETREMSTAQQKPKIITTIEESQNNINKLWKANDDIIKGLQFIATLQLRTPLRVLLRHGEIHTDINTEPPQIAMEMWEGIWTFKTKTYRELGADIDEFPPGTHASDVGQVIPEDYLPFLIAIRNIVELDEPINNRVKKLRNLPILDEWKAYVRKHGGRKRIIEYFFPRFIDTIPKLTLSSIDELAKVGLNTPNRIAAAPDETLLSIKGIGKAKLKAIRDYCAGVTDNRDSDRVENVIK